MAEIASWGGHSFVVSASLLRGIKDMNVKSGLDTEDMTAGSEKFYRRKNARPMQLQITITLYAFLGTDPRAEAMQLSKEAMDGKTDWFYIAGKKLVSCKLMLTDADCDEIELSPTGAWVSCHVKCTFKQATKWDGTTTGATSASQSAGKGSGKSSVRSSGTSGGGSKSSSSTRKKKDIYNYTIELKKQTATAKKPANGGTTITIKNKGSALTSKIVKTNSAKK